MATYGESYYKVLQKVNSEYLGLHNLNALQHLEKKIKCFGSYSDKPHEYYECFSEIEQSRENDSKELVTGYGVIEDEYKLCTEGCKNMVKYQTDSCNNRCGQFFSDSVIKLYDNFYQKKVGGRKEYKKAKH